MKTTLRSIGLLAVLATAVPASASELQLTIANGRVTLIAQDVPVRQILSEWGRLGETRIINGEKLAGPPITLHIVDRPEREVLEMLLRSASGYVAAPRTAGAAGASLFETVMIMPTSRPPAVTTSGPPGFNQRQGFQQPPPQPQPMMPVDDDDGDPRDQGVVPPPGVLPPGAVSMQPGMQPQVQPHPGMMQQPGMVPQNTPQNVPQTPMTAPRPGMLPPQPMVPGNPYQPTPQQPIRRPGGPGGEGS